MIYLPRAWATPEVVTESVVEWEEANCPLCGNRHWTQLVEAPDATPGSAGLWFAVVQCRDCGLCFTNPRPSPASIAQFYPAEYRPHRSPRVSNVADPGFTVRAAPRARVRKEQQLAWHGEGRLLDFGCGTGAFLMQKHRQGWRVTGLDLSPAAVYRVRTELGLHALVGTLPHPELEPGSFDVITMWESLEHVHDPLEVLRQARRLLAPGGRLVVTCPNIDSLPFRWFGQAWFGLDLPRHLTHFAPWTLHLMLYRAGFRVENIRMIRHSLWLRRSARLARRANSKALLHRALHAKPLARMITWYSYLTRQADCLLASAARA